MGKKKMSNTQVAVETIMNKYGGYFDYDAINHLLTITNNEDLGKISKQVVKNIAEWSLNGDDRQKIAERLEMTPKQFNTLCTICPVLVHVMETGVEMANIIANGSLFQTAIGGQFIKKQVVVKVKDYDDGKVVGEHYEKMWVEEELPPNPILLKFIAENKLAEKFGDKKNDQDKIIKDSILNMSKEELENFEKEVKANAKESI